MKINRVYNAYLKKTAFLFILLISLVSIQSNAKEQNKYRDIIIKKEFPFFTCIKANPEILKLVTEDPVLKKLTSVRKEQINLALKECKDADCYANAVQWTSEEVTAAGNELIKLSAQNEQYRVFISTLRASGSYNLYASYNDQEFIRAVLNNVAGGITHILDVYIKGEKPFYAATDSISYKPDNKAFMEEIKGILADKVKEMEGKPFFEMPINMAIDALILNRRDEAARYEPLNEGMNRTAFDNIKNINWNNYPYSVILVPGKGPEKEGVTLDPQSITRCNLAVEYFKKGASPFIVVSGGHVSPNQTPYSEAVEMKRYMVKELNIPENCIFIEPHARHTTTNMRNTVRMIYRFNMPSDKKILIVTDPGQNGFIDKMEQRFIMELGGVPYRELRKLNDNTSEYLPDRNALQCNPKDPLDP
jgi:hypothetical protein